MVFNSVTQEMEQFVFALMISMISEKGDTKKMVSAVDIAKRIREHGEHATLQDVNNTLDVLIGKGHVRYFKNERNFRYYGIPKAIWEQREKGGIA